MATTKIQWTNRVWNPVTGCTKISPGCAHCYAARMAHRLAGRYGYPEAPNQFRVTLHDDKVLEPLRWKKASMIFVDSMGDLFHNDVPFYFVATIFDVMARANWHTFQVLTKRPENLLKFSQWYSQANGTTTDTWPPPNVWLGVSAENQQCADERIPLLLQTPAAVRLVSVEPMLGPVDLRPYLMIKLPDGTPVFSYRQGLKVGLDWVICGCESGPAARPADIEWAASLMYQCQDNHIPFFFKQWMFGTKNLVKLPPLKGKVWDQFPKVTHV